MVPARAEQVRRGIWLEWLTIAYNCLEGLIAIGAGMLAGSIALVGFGFDSVIEVASGVALLWRLHGDGSHRREARERLSLRVVGACFAALAVYVAYEAIESLVSGIAPRSSWVGTALAVASLIIMPVLARAKRRVAAGIGSSAMTADAKQTELCSYLSAILLGGLALNGLLGWWWADPVAALIMVPIIAKEGWDGLRGKTCCACGHT